jgi:WD40 repeat protein
MTSSSSIKREIKTDHKDLIQDIAFDYYGKRVATASLDQTVKIWNINEKNEWILKEELKVYCSIAFISVILYISSCIGVK